MAKIINGKLVRDVVEPKLPRANCQTCPLYNRRHIEPSAEPFMDSSGNSKMEILIVGESPGREELNPVPGEKVGKPFRGNSGHLLRETLKEKNLLEKGIFYTNILMCDPVSIKVTDKDIASVRSEKRAKWKIAVAACSARLNQEIELVSPKLIISLGGEAKDALLPKVQGNITSVSGEFHNDGLYDYLTVVHPAFILRKSGERYQTKFGDDLNEAALFFNKPHIDIEVEVAKTSEDVRRFLRDLSNSNPLIVDVETTSLSPWAYREFEIPKATADQSLLAMEKGYTLQSGKKFKEGELLSIQLSGSGNLGYVIPADLIKDETLKDELADFLESHNLSCHNAVFDIVFLRKIFGRKFTAAHDTMMMSYASDESQEHGLKRLTRARLGIQDWSKDLEVWRKNRKDSFAVIPPEVLHEYGGIDTAATFLLLDSLKESMDEDESRLYTEVLIPITNLFIDMQHRGVAINSRKLAATATALLEEKAIHDSYLVREFGVSNANSTKQVSNALKVHFDIPEDIGTGKDVLKQFERGGEASEFSEWEWRRSEFVKNIKASRGCRQAHSTFVTNLARAMEVDPSAVLYNSESDALFPIHPSFKLWATMTGRIVIGDPSITNYPKGTPSSAAIRECFEARPGYVWFHADYKQFELRIYAALTGDPGMAEIFLIPDSEGRVRDPHSEIGLTTYGTEYWKLNEQENGNTRRGIKEIVFGRLYRRGVNAIAKQLGWTVDRAQTVVDAVDKMFPMLNVYHEDVINDLVNFQKIMNPLGRSRRFPILTDENLDRCINQAVNFKIQSTASDLNLMTMMEIQRVFGEEVHPLFSIHDSVDMEIREDRANLIIPEIVDIMQTFPMKFFPTSNIPMLVDWNVSKFWMAE